MRYIMGHCQIVCWIIDQKVLQLNVKDEWYSWEACPSPDVYHRGWDQSLNCLFSWKMSLITSILYSYLFLRSALLLWVIWLEWHCCIFCKCQLAYCIRIFLECRDMQNNQPIAPFSESRTIQTNDFVIYIIPAFLKRTNAQQKDL